MRIDIDLRVTGANLRNVTVLKPLDFAHIGAKFATQLRTRTDSGVNAEGKPITPGSTGKYLDVSGAFRRSIKPRRVSDRGATVGAAVPYAKRLADLGKNIFGVTPNEAVAVAEAIGEAVDANLRASTR